MTESKNVKVKITYHKAYDGDGHQLMKGQVYDMTKAEARSAEFAGIGEIQKDEAKLVAAVADDNAAKESSKKTAASK